jgi:signal transduction histidine kinase
MNIFPRSLRQKVILGYIIGLILMLGVVLVNWSNLTHVTNMVRSSEKVSDLFETTLEIRRYEKNYFLYGENEDYEELLTYLWMAEELIEKTSKKFSLFTNPQNISELRTNIKEYRELWEKMQKSGSKDIDIGKERIREKGKEIVTIAENMLWTEKEIMQTTLRSARNILIVSIIFLVSAGFITGAVFYRMFIKPLRLLEGQTKMVADGEFSFIPVVSQDREMVSLTRAFNRMILELELRQMRSVAQSDKLASLGTMVSGVAHQLNNPLSNISTSCQILLEEIEESDADTIKEILQQIEGQIERAKNMVHSLLQFSKKKEFKSEPLPIKNLVEETIRLIQGDIPTGVEVVVDIPEECCLIVDKQRIQQAILNIIKNGIDAIPDEGRVSISAKEKLANKTIEIKIQDTGIGIEPENINKIFDPFFTTKEDGKGTGLGLSVSREIIEEHQGLIEVDSIVGQGTTFTIKLPLKEL